MGQSIELVGQATEFLPPGARAERYREFANEALRRSAEARTPEQRSEYLSMASGWHTMALEMERAGNNLAQIEASQSRLRPAEPGEH